MPVNKRSKYRGSRTCGGGTHKNRRGGGSRGGRGKAGGCKHHFVRNLMEGRYYGKQGFTTPTASEVTALDVGTLDTMADALLDQGQARREGDLIVIDATLLGVDKVLGSGQVRRKMAITAAAFSAQARAKLEKAGGQAILT